MHAQEALKRFIAEGSRSVLDVGAGAGLHAAEMRRAGLSVTTVDIAGAQDIVGDYLEVPLNRQYSAIWCSHVLEHLRNPGQFLNKVFQDLEPGGLLSITVPPMRTKLVGGHINQFYASVTGLSAGPGGVRLQRCPRRGLRLQRLSVGAEAGGSAAGIGIRPGGY
jgi:SAM-dependent methyltransferase